MKKYEIPRTEVVETKLSANYLLGTSDTYTDDPAYSRRKKDNYIPEEEEDDDEGGFGW